MIDHNIDGCLGYFEVQGSTKFYNALALSQNIIITAGKKLISNLKKNGILNIEFHLQENIFGLVEYFTIQQADLVLIRVKNKLQINEFPPINIYLKTITSLRYCCIPKQFTNQFIYSKSKNLKSLPNQEEERFFMKLSGVPIFQKQRKEIIGFYQEKGLKVLFDQVIINKIKKILSESKIKANPSEHKLLLGGVVSAPKANDLKMISTRVISFFSPNRPFTTRIAGFISTSTSFPLLAMPNQPFRSFPTMQTVIGNRYFALIRNPSNPLGQAELPEARNLLQAKFGLIKFQNGKIDENCPYAKLFDSSGRTKWLTHLQKCITNDPTILFKINLLSSTQSNSGNPPRVSASYINQISTKQFAQIHISQQHINQINLCHGLARFLGGKDIYLNVFYGSALFNQISHKTIEDSLQKIKKQLAGNPSLINFQYQVQLQLLQLKDQQGKKFYVTFIPDKVFIRFIAQNTIGIKISLGQIAMNPWIFSSQNTQRQMSVKFVDEMLNSIFLKFGIKLPKPKALQLMTNILKNLQDNPTQSLQSICLLQYEQYSTLINQKIKNDKILTLNQSVFNVTVIRKDQAQEKSIQIQLQQKCGKLLQEILKVNFLSKVMDKVMIVDKITLEIKKGRLGYLLYFQSQPFDIPSFISTALTTIFKINQPKIIVKGAIALEENFLAMDDKPDFFMVEADIQNKTQQNQNIIDLSYSFSELGLALSFSLQNEGDYRVDWRIHTKVQINNLTESPIILDASLNQISNTYQLAAQFNLSITNFLKISGFDIDGLHLFMTFGATKSLTLKCFLQISDIEIIIIGMYTQKMLTLSTMLQNLTMQNIQALIQKITKKQLATRLDLTFQNIDLLITYDRIKKQFDFGLTIEVKVEGITFKGQLKYNKDSLSLLAGADKIQFNILNKKIIISNPRISLTKLRQLYSLGLSGEIAYKSQIDSSQPDLKIQASLDIQKQSGKTSYCLKAQVQIDNEPTIHSYLRILSQNIQLITFVCASDSYRQEDTTKPKKYLAATLQQYKLFKQEVTFEIFCGISPLSIGAVATFNQATADTNFIALKSISFSANISNNPSIQLALVCIIPKHNLELIGSIKYSSGGNLQGTLEMKGVIKFNKYISFGYEPSKGTTFFKIIYNKGLWGVGFQSQLTVCDIQVKGGLTIMNQIPTRIMFGLENINLSGIINLIKKMFLGRVDDQSSHKPISQNMTLLQIKNCSFDCDLLIPKYQVNIQIIIFDNQFKLYVKYQKTSFLFQATIQYPISIMDIISISSASDKKKGPQFLMSLDDSKGFRLDLDGKLIFGPLSVKAIVHVENQVLKADVHLELFTVNFDASILLDNKRHKYAFQVEFTTKQIDSFMDYINKIIRDETGLKQNKIPLTKSQNLEEFRTSQKDFMNQFKNIKNQAINKYNSNKQLFTKLFGPQTKQALKKIYASKQLRQKQKKKQISQLQQKLLPITNFMDHRLSNGFNIKDQTDPQPYQVQAQRLQQEIKNKQQRVINLLDEQEQMINNINQLYQSTNTRQQKGLWSNFTRFVGRAYHAIADIVQDIVDNVLPVIKKFLIGGKIQSEKGWKFTAYLKLQFQFLKKTYNIEYKWNTHFDAQTIQQAAINRMINISLEHVRAVYIIPQSIYQRYYQALGLQKIYSGIKDKKVPGMNVSYQNSMNIILQKKVCVISMKIQPVTLLFISKQNNTKDQYCLSFSKNLDFEFVVNSEKQKLTKPFTMQAFFCDHVLPTEEFFKKAMTTSDSAGTLNNYRSEGPKQLRGFLLKPKETINQITQSSAYQSVYNNLFNNKQIELFRFFKAVEVKQDKEVYMTYEFRDNFVLAMTDGKNIKLVKKDTFKHYKEISHMWKQIPVLPQMQQGIQ